MLRSIKWSGMLFTSLKRIKHLHGTVFTLPYFSVLKMSYIHRYKKVSRTTMAKSEFSESVTIDIHQWLEGALLQSYFRPKCGSGFNEKGKPGVLRGCSEILSIGIQSLLVEMILIRSVDIGFNRVFSYPHCVHLRPADRPGFLK